MHAKNQVCQQLQNEWDTAVERAQQENERVQDLGELLTDSSGLHIKSGVQAGGLWGTTTSCTCENCTHICR